MNPLSYETDEDSDNSMCNIRTSARLMGSISESIDALMPVMIHDAVTKGGHRDH